MEGTTSREEMKKSFTHPSPANCDKRSNMRNSNTIQNNQTNQTQDAEIDGQHQLELVEEFVSLLSTAKVLEGENRNDLNKPLHVAAQQLATFFVDTNDDQTTKKNPVGFCCTSPSLNVRSRRCYGKEIRQQEAKEQEECRRNASPTSKVSSIGGTIISSNRKALEDSVATNLSQPIQWTRSELPDLPITLLNNLLESFNTLLDSRLRTSLSAFVLNQEKQLQQQQQQQQRRVLFPNKRSGPTNSSSTSSTSPILTDLLTRLLSEADAIRPVAVVTKFLVVPCPLEMIRCCSPDGNSLAVPVVLQCVYDIVIMNNNNTQTVTIEAPGTMQVSFAPPLLLSHAGDSSSNQSVNESSSSNSTRRNRSLLSYVDIELDTVAMLSAMMTRARTIVKIAMGIAIRMAADLLHNHPQTVLTWLSSGSCNSSSSSSSSMSSSMSSSTISGLSSHSSTTHWSSDGLSSHSNHTHRSSDGLSSRSGHTHRSSDGQSSHSTGSQWSCDGNVPMSKSSSALLSPSSYSSAHALLSCLSSSHPTTGRSLSTPTISSLCSTIFGGTSSNNSVATTATTTSSSSCSSLGKRKMGDNKSKSTNDTTIFQEICSFDGMPPPPARLPSYLSTQTATTGSTNNNIPLSNCSNATMLALLASHHQQQEQERQTSSQLLSPLLQQLQQQKQQQSSFTDLTNDEILIQQLRKFVTQSDPKNNLHNNEDNNRTTLQDIANSCSKRQRGIE